MFNFIKELNSIYNFIQIIIIYSKFGIQILYCKIFINFRYIFITDHFAFHFNLKLKENYYVKSIY